MRCEWTLHREFQERFLTKEREGKLHSPCLHLPLALGPGLKMSLLPGTPCTQDGLISQHTEDGNKLET